MQVNSISSPAINAPSPEQRPAVRASAGAPDQAEFDKSRSLEESLDGTPEIRGAEVDRARELASSVQYPPEELIDRISNLLARHWNQSDE